MRMIFGLVLLLGVGLAGFAVYMAQGYIGRTEAQLQKERAERARFGPMTEVFVVTRPMNYGDPLRPEDVAVIPWPKKSLPETAFTDKATLFPDGAPPRLILRQMEQYEPLLAVKVTEPGADAGITTRLAKGMRAFAIKVDVASGVSGFLRPGDSVDVYWTGQVAGVEGEMTRLIESTIPIVAVDQTSTDDGTAPTIIARTVTVEATPEQVARLAQAQATGRLALSLVGSGDREKAADVEVDSNRLLGITTEDIVQVEAPKVCTVRTRKGAEVLDMPIPCTN
jgi:pilus assembly protein CpaB